MHVLFHHTEWIEKRHVIASKGTHFGTRINVQIVERGLFHAQSGSRLRVTRRAVATADTPLSLA